MHHSWTMLRRRWSWKVSGRNTAIKRVSASGLEQESTGAFSIFSSGEISSLLKNQNLTDILLDWTPVHSIYNIKIWSVFWDSYPTSF